MELVSQLSKCPLNLKFFPSVVLPGKLLTLDAQCRKDRGTSACFKDDRVCAQLFCFDAGSGYCVSYRPAAEGSRCGDGAVILMILLGYDLLDGFIMYTKVDLSLRAGLYLYR